MKTKEQLEVKIARSKARVESRNERKYKAMLLQDIPMLLPKDERDEREESGKRPILRKNWKEIEICRLTEARNNTPKDVKPKDFHCDELKARRKDRRERLKKIKQAEDNSCLPQAIYYKKGSNCSKRKTDARIRFEMRIMLLRGKDAARAARRQSREDKAKYEASLVAFKETYIRTYKVQEINILDDMHYHKKNRKAGRKSTAKVYSTTKDKLAA